jgi:hypothetical protein
MIVCIRKTKGTNTIMQIRNDKPLKYSVNPLSVCYLILSNQDCPINFAATRTHLNNRYSWMPLHYKMRMMLHINMQFACKLRHCICRLLWAPQHLTAMRFKICRQAANLLLVWYTAQSSVVSERNLIGF